MTHRTKLFVILFCFGSALGFLLGRGGRAPVYDEPPKDPKRGEEIEVGELCVNAEGQPARSIGGGRCIFYRADSANVILIGPSYPWPVGVVRRVHPDFLPEDADVKAAWWFEQDILLI